MLSWLNSNVGAITAVATIVLVLVTTAYVLLTYALVRVGRRQLLHIQERAITEDQRPAGERSATANAYRYLLFAEFLRLSAPYKRLLESWTGDGYRTFPAGLEFASTSPALIEGLAHIHLLTPEEQQAAASIARSLAIIRPDPTENAFHAHQRPSIARLVDDVTSALLLIQERLPHHNVSAESRTVYEALGSGEEAINVPAGQAPLE